jgi:hypothetical protein
MNQKTQCLAKNIKKEKKTASHGKLFGGWIIALLVCVGLVWAQTPDKSYNRPEPQLDYVPQELGTFDGDYLSLLEGDCRICHGDSLADRHHYSDLALNTGACDPCHVMGSGGWEVENDCTVSGCHSSADRGAMDGLGDPPNGWHHATHLAFVSRCTACHDSRFIDHIADDEPVLFSEQPPVIYVHPPFGCENCHWEQPVIENTAGWNVDDGPPFPSFAEAGHPSTYDHNEPPGAYNVYGSQSPSVPADEYFEYGKRIESNRHTHHTLQHINSRVDTNCVRCHSQDPNDSGWDPSRPGLIRYCETCHDISNLHAIEPHWGYQPASVNFWEAAGFHVPNTSNTDTTDVAPTVYRSFVPDENCYGCHADQSTTGMPPSPASVPKITDMTPEVSPCDGHVTLAGANFGDQKTQERTVQVKRTSGGSWWVVPVLSWTSTEIEFQIPCWIFGLGNFYVTVETEVGLSNVAVLTHTSKGSVDAISPASGKCREIITVTGTNFGSSQDTIIGTFGIYKAVQFLSPEATYTASAVGAWTGAGFKVRFGDLFEDEDGDLLRDPSEPLLNQCEDMVLGTYPVYVKAVYYEDTDSSGAYSEGDPIHREIYSNLKYFTVDEGPALYLIQPRNVERSHYCPDDTLVNGVIRIYGWGFGPDQGDGAVYVGTGPMYATDTGLELNRMIWSDLLITAAVDVPPGAQGMNLFVWIVKGGEKTNSKYGWPQIQILDTETCP